MQKTVGVSIFVIICTVVVSSVSTAIPNWIYADEDFIKAHTGLWEECVKVGGSGFICAIMPNVNDWVKAVRALMILGTILLGISLLLACIFARDLSIHSRANKCIFCLISGGILLIIAVIVFAIKVDLGDARIDFSYDSAFYLAIAAAVVAILTAAVVHKAKSTSRNGYTAI